MCIRDRSIYTVSQKNRHHITISFYNSVKIEAILIIFGTHNLKTFDIGFCTLVWDSLKSHHTTLWNAERFQFFIAVWFLAKTKQLWKTAGYYVIQKLEFQTTSVKGTVKSYYRLRWHHYCISDTDLSPWSASIQTMSQQRADMASTDVMHVS